MLSERDIPVIIIHMWSVCLSEQDWGNVCFRKKDGSRDHFDIT